MLFTIMDDYNSQNSAQTMLAQSAKDSQENGQKMEKKKHSGENILLLFLISYF